MLPFSWHCPLVDQSRRASFASVRQSSMETPPNTTPQPFRQPVSSAKTPEWASLVETHWDVYGIFCSLCLIFRVFSIGGWRAPSRGRKASRSWTGPAASNRWFCPGFVVLTKRGKSWNESPETVKILQALQVWLVETKRSIEVFKSFGNIPFTSGLFWSFPT